MNAMKKILLSAFLLMPFVFPFSQENARIVYPKHGLPGSIPGTERWLVNFKTRSFDLSEFREAIYSREPAQVVENIVKGLERKVKEDQADFVEFIKGLGGKVIAQWWIVNACAIEIPFSKLDEVRKHPRVLRMFPDEEVAPLSPIKTSTNCKNHCVDPLQAKGYLGKGATVAIMDTGLDTNMGGSGRPHRTFYVNGDPNNKTGGGIGGSRVLANIKIGKVGPDDVHGHGTGVAGIAAGEKWLTSGADKGHAPMASLVGYCIANSSSGGCTYTEIVKAWQHIAADKTKYGIVAANNSYTGSPDPTHVSQQALDSAALNADILPVVAGGNFSSSTRRSQSCANGIAVGATSPNTKKMAYFSSRGPLYGDTQRYYPDMCANGVKTVMPKRDRETTDYVASGTSMASPQVCGCATLFRSVKKNATALETKAAILASTEDVSKQNNKPPYNTRNAYGVGYLRDDKAIDIALGKGLLLSSTISKNSPKKVFQMNVTKGKAYSVVITWHRHVLTSKKWSNLALEVKYGSTSLGKSDTPRNLYEKVVFLSPATGKVNIEVTYSYLEKDPLTFAVASIEVPPAYIPGKAFSYGKGCRGTGKYQGVATVAPSIYKNKFGESAGYYIFGYRNHKYQQIVDAKYLPTSFVATGMALRHDDRYVRSYNNYWAEVEIKLGYSSNSPRNMSRYFSNNISGTLTTVVNKRKINVPYWTTKNTSPSNWIFKFAFDRPFAYVKQANKHLLIDAKKTNSSRGNNYSYIYFDCVYNRSTYPTSRLYTYNLSSNYGYLATGFGLVIGFTRTFTGAIPILDSSGYPEIANTFKAQISRAKENSYALMLLGLSNTSWRGYSLPIDLGIVGAPGCKLLTGIELIEVRPTNSKGEAAFTYAIPNVKSLINMKFYLQGVIVDPPANASGTAWTNGLDIIIGGQP